jgi:hypothetical protein
MRLSLHIPPVVRKKNRAEMQYLACIPLVSTACAPPFPNSGILPLVLLSQPSIAGRQDTRIGLYRGRRRAGAWSPGVGGRYAA